MKKLIISLLLASPITMLAMESNNNNAKIIDAQKALTMEERETLESRNCDAASWFTWLWCGPCLAVTRFNAELHRTEVELAAYMVKKARLKKEYNAIMVELGFKEDPALYEKEVQAHNELLKKYPNSLAPRPEWLDIAPSRYVQQDGSQLQHNDVESCASRDENLQHSNESGTFDKEK